MAVNPVEELLEKAPEIEKRLGYTFIDKKLLLLAFVHRSFINEHRDILSEHNERLEFLGDSILGMIVSDFLFHHFPNRPEGELSHLRAQVVESAQCERYMRKLRLADHLLLGKGEMLNEGKSKGSILADAFEAIIGAIYADGGIEKAREFFAEHFESDMLSLVEEPLRNHKAELQDYSQKKTRKPPTYRVVKETGPDHSKIFHVAVEVEGNEIGFGMGTSKKQAEQAAAANALKALGI